MAENSAIEWTDHTFNPWIGCQKVGPGCDHCYAETLATARLGVKWGPGAERRRTAPSTWKLPRRWNSRAEKLGIRYRVFCSSLADVFDNAAPRYARADLAPLILATPYLDWLLLTKRIGNAPAMLAEMFPAGVPANVRVGATVVNHEEWLRDFPKMQAVFEHTGKPLFLSIEPMLGPIDLDAFGPAWRKVIGWVIVGGESGHGARPMHPDWARTVAGQCAGNPALGLAAVPFMFKQWGEWAPADPWYADHPVSLPLRGWGPDGWTDDGLLLSKDSDYVARLGKKAAGRVLDGRTWDGVPA